MSEKSNNSSSELDIERRWLLHSQVDPEQYVRFYDKYYDLIYGFLLNRTRNPDFAEDLCQATFIQAFEKRWSFRFQRVTFGAWLYRIASNLANQEDRRRKVRNPVPLDHNDSCLVDSVALQDEKLLAQIDNDDLVRCLTEIDPECRTWITLHYIEGLTTPEVAAIAGVPQGTMKARLSRCLNKMRARMRRDHD
jgi:RNA polymerase sigma-70 factor (ECF subfamily)